MNTTVGITTRRYNGVSVEEVKHTHTMPDSLSVQKLSEILDLQDGSESVSSITITSQEES
ncbi:MAG: hypothetical protein SOI13_01405 [Bifidobacterium mongoliense]|jgi:hypothetical protein|uniref:hypothetical protein n=1 Tax=Bifidobacterium mongoliense TaxID=518643 RepID=UPI002F35659F